MTTYSQLFAELKRGDAGRVETSIPESWMQGRTTYGGLTAALCLESAKTLADDMPIRSAQVAFVGPVAGDVVISPRLLRRGKNTAFIAVDMVTELGIAASCIFTFGVSRQSSLQFENLPAPEAGDPDKLPAFFRDDRRRPKFTRNFNIRLVSGPPPISGSDDPNVCLWLRHVDEAAHASDAVALLALADAPPPAALSMLTVPGPASSMTWMAEFLTDDPMTTDGWWLLKSSAETAIDGYSSQAMTVWNRDGAPVMVGRQTVAIFG